MNRSLSWLKLWANGSWKFCKTHMGAKCGQQTSNSLSTSLRRKCAKYTCAAYINTHPWLAKMWRCQKSNFCSGEWAHYAKHLLQWRRVLLFVVLVWQDKCVTRWWCALPYEWDISLSQCLLNFCYIYYMSSWSILRFEYPARFRRRVRMKNSMLQCAIVRVSCWYKAAIARKEQSGFSSSSRFETWQKREVYPRAAVSFNLIIIMLYSLMHCVKMQQAY